MKTCNHTEGHFHEPLACGTTNPDRAERLRRMYGEDYHGPTGAYRVRGHNCAYVEERNALIPIAERIAREQTAARFGSDTARASRAASLFESRAFLDAMTKLWNDRADRARRSAE